MQKGYSEEEIDETINEQETEDLEQLDLSLLEVFVESKRTMYIEKKKQI
jgi:hypothetical protein